VPILPISPRLKRYSGSKPELMRKSLSEQAIAIKIAEHVNALIANNPSEIQQYIFADIASDLDVTTEQVRSAISDGGYNGITLRVREVDREKLKRYISNLA
jgi:hypothetical protein